MKNGNVNTIFKTSWVIKFFDGLPKTMRGKFEGLVPKTSNSLMVKSDGLI